MFSGVSPFEGFSFEGPLGGWCIGLDPTGNKANAYMHFGKFRDKNAKSNRDNIMETIYYSRERLHYKNFTNEILNALRK